MNQTKKTILLAALFAAILAGATVSYQYLSGKYTPPSEAVVLPTPNNAGDGVPAKPESTEPSLLEEHETEVPSAETSTEASTDPSTDPSTDTVEETAAETDPPFTPAPDFTVQNEEGESVSLSDYVGKPVIINFWATWCGPCKSELPAFDAAYREYGEDVHFLMVNLTDGTQETVDKVKKFVENGGYSFPVLFDTESDGAMTYGVYSIPLTVFVDARGNLLGGHPGAMSAQTLEEYVDILLTYYANP